ncbi:MAG: ribonuclease III [Oscillospiraceae bacterium]|nr:ribonuclease III [Oscillospiraceae bacterium]
MLTKPLTKKQLDSLSPLALASVGDSVYDLMVRVHLCTKGVSQAGKLHQARVWMVNAKAQAKAAEAILPLLTDQEHTVFRRGRNTQSGNVPQSASREEYQSATAFEALIGYLYLTDKYDRLRELTEIAWANTPIQAGFPGVPRT